MALVTTDGNTIAKSPGTSVLQPVAEADPQIKVLVDVYKLSPYDGVEFPAQMRQLRFRAGQVIRQSEWNREFNAPEIIRMSPVSGPADGGTTVTILGRMFGADTTVTFGGTAATNVHVVNDARLSCTSPAHAAGVVDVVVTCSGGSVTVTGGFTYIAPDPEP